MELREISINSGVVVDGYGPGFFRLNGQVHEGAVLVLPTGVHPWGGYQDTKTLLTMVDKLDVLFVGTGAEIAHAPEEFRTALENADLGIEVMNTPSACRTYNILLSEGRRVGLALFPV